MSSLVGSSASLATVSSFDARSIRESYPAPVLAPSPLIGLIPAAIPGAEFALMHRLDRYVGTTSVLKAPSSVAL